MRFKLAILAFTKWLKRDIAIDRITTELLARYVSHRAQKRARGTIEKDLAFISRMLKGNGFDVDLPPVRGKEEKPNRPFTTSELQAFFKACAQYPTNDPGRYTPLFLMLLSTGARPAELVPSPRSSHVALLKKDIDMENENVIIYGAKRKAGKPSKTSRIPVAKSLLKLCLEHAPEGPYLFREMDMAQDFDRILKKAKISKIDERGEKLTAHSFRHTYGTMLAEAGASAYIIQNILRHADPRMTSKYLAHATAKIEIIDIDQYLPGAGPQKVSKAE